MGKGNRRKKNLRAEFAIATMNLVAAVLTLLISILQILIEFLKD